MKKCEIKVGGIYKWSIYPLIVRCTDITPTNWTGVVLECYNYPNRVGRTEVGWILNNKYWEEAKEYRFKQLMELYEQHKSRHDS